VVSVLGIPTPSPAHAGGLLTVNTVDELPDLVNADGLCLTAAGTCSLRAAIMVANSTTEPDTISFDIPGPGPHAIIVGGPAVDGKDLPAITSPTVIDATTEPDHRGAPVVELRPAPTTRDYFDGLHLTEGAPGSVVRGLAITTFSDGIDVEADGAVIEGNYLGIHLPFPTDPWDDPGSVSGISVTADDVVIGGPSEAQRNVIANSEDGIWVAGGSNRLVVENNFIGTDPSGSVAQGNSYSGVYLSSGSHARIVRNVVSGNYEGIELSYDARSAEVVGNLVGTDSSGLNAIPNEYAGIYVQGPWDSDATLGLRIGGSSDTDRNIIAGNGASGIDLYDASGVSVENNFVGLNAEGEPLGNLGDGISCTECMDIDVIDNVISDNGDGGIHIHEWTQFVSENVFQANLIGTDPTGAPVSGYGNTGAGVHLEGASGNLIGGTPAEGNIVAQNGQGGILIHERTFSDTLYFVPAVANTVSGNQILQNGGLGIDLGNDGVTPNDPGDGDSGANLSQNHPVLTRAFTHGNSTKIEGTLDSAPGSYNVELFLSDGCDPSAFSEGTTTLAVVDVTVAPSGATAWSLILHEPLAAGTALTATATDQSGNTSEFSTCTAVDTPGGGGAQRQP
jgi:parallel beta-helix repeat protein